MFLSGILLWLSHTLCCIGWSLKILGHNFLMSSPGVSLVNGKRKKLGSREDLLRIGLRLPDTRFGWLLVGAFHGRLPAAAGNGRKLCHPRETSLCAPAKSGEAKFFFHALVFDEALDYGLVYIVFFRYKFFFILSSMYVVYVVGG